MKITIPLTVSFFTEESLKLTRLRSATKQRQLFTTAKAAVKQNMAIIRTERGV